MVELVEYISESLQVEQEEDGELMSLMNHTIRAVDIDRVKYWLRDYLRIRLWKLTQWPQHYREPERQGLLSDAERTFLHEYWRAKESFLKAHCLQYVPETKQRLDQKTDLQDMVRRPQLDSFVFVRVLKHVGPVTLPPTFSQSQDSSSSTDELQEGNTYLVTYVAVRHLLMEPEHNGKVLLV